VDATPARSGELAALHQLAAAAGGSRDLESFLRTGSEIVVRVLGAQDLAVYSSASRSRRSGARLKTARAWA